MIVLVSRLVRLGLLLTDNSTDHTYLGSRKAALGFVGNNSDHGHVSEPTDIAG